MKYREIFKIGQIMTPFMTPILDTTMFFMCSDIEFYTGRHFLFVLLKQMLCLSKCGYIYLYLDLYKAILSPIKFLLK